ncbi:MAG: GGDEF domain-containing protein [Burkholderiales bacterium]
MPAQRRPVLKGVHRLSLKFIDRQLETAYRHYLSARPLRDARLVLGLGLAGYALIGVLDPYFVPDADRSVAWLIRVAVLLFGMVVLLFTFHSLFRSLDQVAIALTGIAAAAGLAGVMNLMPVHAMSQYFASVIIVVFWTYLFPGMRFVHGLWSNAGIVLVFYLSVASIGYIDEQLLSASAIFLLASSVLAGTEAYARERRRRMYYERSNQAPAETPAPGTRLLHDRLTGLPSRVLLADRLDQAIVAARRDSRKCAGMYLDIDDFGTANTLHGRDAGDEMLQILAQRLRETMRESDTVARLDNDDYFVITRDVDPGSGADAIAERLLACVAQPIPLFRGETVRLNAILGICLFPYPDCTADDIVYRAELAVQSARTSGEDRHVYADAENADTRRMV